MDFVRDLRFVDHFPPGFDFASDENLGECVLRDALCHDLVQYRVLRADDREDGIFRDGDPVGAFSLFVR